MLEKIIKVTLLEGSNILIKLIFLIGLLMFVIAIVTMLFKKKYTSSKYKKNRKKYLTSAISTVDIMEGIEFEHFLKYHYEELGYKVKLTNQTNDYGADLILKNSKETIVVQAKRYKSNVGIKAIQEICGSLPYFKANRGVVVTNSNFTKNAIELARVNNIELIDREQLLKIMKKNKISGMAKQVVEQTISNKDCPKCKGVLVKKHGSYGMFWACDNYPKCSFTRKV